MKNLNQWQNNKHLLYSKPNIEQLFNFDVGSVVLVKVIRLERNREVVMDFAGICIKRKNRGLTTNFTLRNIVSGFAVEQNFLLYSPLIISISVIKKHEVQKSNLFYLRHRNPRFSKFKFVFLTESFDLTSNYFNSYLNNLSYAVPMFRNKPNQIIRF